MNVYEIQQSNINRRVFVCVIWQSSSDGCQKISFVSKFLHFYLQLSELNCCSSRKLHGCSSRPSRLSHLAFVPSHFPVSPHHILSDGLIKSRRRVGRLALSKNSRSSVLIAEQIFEGRSARNFKRPGLIYLSCSSGQVAEEQRGSSNNVARLKTWKEPKPPLDLFYLLSAHTHVYDYLLTLNPPTSTKVKWRHVWRLCTKFCPIIT